jgi:hypothetical protein
MSATIGPSSANVNDSEDPPHSSSLLLSSSAISAAITHLLELNINCLAVDFDLTLIDIHTSGRYPGPVTELVAHVRPLLAQLIRAALVTTHPDGSPAFFVTIVTFSVQTSLVRQVLDHVLGPELSANIPIRGGDRSWSYQGPGSQHGKQHYIASAVEELLAPYTSAVRPSITKNTTLLVDDDRRNIAAALQDGTRAIWFNPDKPHRLIKDLLRLV